jgi:hypothetical protein
MLPKPIFPPRPAGKLLHTHLPRYEESGEWVAQRKFCGKHVVVWVGPDGAVGIWGREQEPLVRFKPTEEIFDQFRALKLESGNGYWFAGELYHQKTKDPHYQNRIVLFDCLQAGKQLFILKPDQMGRLALLSDICRHPTQLEPRHGIALVVSENIWMAETFDRDFVAQFNQFIHVPEIEGLVLRRKTAALKNFCGKYWETGDLIRVRKPSKAYTH